MTEHQAYKPARLWRRAAARLVDTCAMAVIEAAAVIVTFVITALASGEGFLVDDKRLEGFYTLWLLLLVPASIPAYLFEAGTTARFGRTFGKRLWDICVVPWDGETAAVSDPAQLEHWRYGARWAIPHGAGLSVAVVAGVVSFSTIGEVGVAVPTAGIAAWLLAYLSSLFDKNRRGWHDKAAGTMVVHATDDVVERLQERAARGRGPAPPEQPQPATARAESPEDSPSHAKESWGMVSDYHAPRRTLSPPEAGDANPTQTQ